MPFCLQERAWLKFGHKNIARIELSFTGACGFSYAANRSTHYLNSLTTCSPWLAKQTKQTTEPHLGDWFEIVTLLTACTYLLGYGTRIYGWNNGTMFPILWFTRECFAACGEMFVLSTFSAQERERERYTRWRAFLQLCEDACEEKQSLWDCFGWTEWGFGKSIFLLNFDTI